MDTFPFRDTFLLPALSALVAGIILATLFGALKWSLKKHLIRTLPVLIVTISIAWFASNRSRPEIPVEAAGIVVDFSTDEPIGQAVVSVFDEKANDVSEDNGNFSLALPSELRNTRVRVHAAKEGYGPSDDTTEVPTHNLVIRLKRR